MPQLFIRCAVANRVSRTYRFPWKLLNRGVAAHSPDLDDAVYTGSLNRFGATGKYRVTKLNELSKQLKGFGIAYMTTRDQSHFLRIELDRACVPIDHVRRWEQIEAEIQQTFGLEIRRSRFKFPKRGIKIRKRRAKQTAR